MPRQRNLCGMTQTVNESCRKVSDYANTRIAYLKTTVQGVTRCRLNRRDTERWLEVVGLEPTGAGWKAERSCEPATPKNERAARTPTDLQTC